MAYAQQSPTEAEILRSSGFWFWKQQYKKQLDVCGTLLMYAALRQMTALQCVILTRKNNNKALFWFCEGLKIACWRHMCNFCCNQLYSVQKWHLSTCRIHQESAANIELFLVHSKCHSRLDKRWWWINVSCSNVFICLWVNLQGRCVELWWLCCSPWTFTQLAMGNLLKGHRRVLEAFLLYISWAAKARYIATDKQLSRKRQQELYRNRC